jgi:hypothetical protein
MNHTQTPKQKQPNWELIVAILSLIVGTIAGVPSVYEFAEKRGLFPQTQATPNPTQQKIPFIF